MPAHNVSLHPTFGNASPPRARGFWLRGPSGEWHYSAGRGAAAAHAAATTPST